MFKHNFTLIYRSFKRFKSSFFINLIGLSTGLACTLLIYLWVNNELTVDKFHENDSRLFKVLERHNNAGGIGVMDSTPGVLAETLKDEMPEVEYAAVATPHYWFDKFTLSVKNKNVEANGIYASKDFFKIFSYGFNQGDASQALVDKSSIVISEDLAKQLFGTTENLIGKAVEFQHAEEYLITGIFKGTPTNSTSWFEFVLSFEKEREINPGVAEWGNSGPMTYVLLKEGQDPKAFEDKISGLITRKAKVDHRSLIIQKYSDGYLHGRYENGVQAGGRIEYVILFSLIALFILIIACINFMNLSTAKASRRIKEVGIKKAVGAGRRVLVFQYLGESMLMSFLSLAVAVLIVDLFLPQFNVITGKQLALTFDPIVILTFFSIAFFTGVISGSYPALYLSGFNPAIVLKGKLTTSLGERWARQGLVVFQFTLSIIFIVTVLVIYRQIDFLQNRNLGYDKDNVLYFQIEGKLKDGLETFLNEVKNIPGVVDASSAGQSMVGGGNNTDIGWEGKDPDLVVPFFIRPVNYGFIEMMGVKIKEGRSFKRELDSGGAMKVIFNQAGIDVMGFKDPLGRIVTVGDDYKFEIVGVVENFHFESLHSSVGPLFFVLGPPFTQKIMVKLASGKERETIRALQDFYNKFNPGFSFDYQFVDAEYQAQYAAEQRVSILSRYFAGLAVLISCLGLFGLASFTAERRTKEIGIRKVLGSSEANIVYLLSTDFTKIVLVAIVIAVPVSYMMVKLWLADFAYKIPLSWWYFAGSGLIALMIAWLTVGLQAFKAARISPARCLKDE